MSLLLRTTQRLVLPDAHFRRICQLIYQRVGTVLADYKWDIVYNRLIRHLRTLRLSDFGHYLSTLEANQNDPEWQAFTSSLTTNLITFFREGHHFPVLSDHVHRRSGEYCVWNAAVSTKEEPYNTTITLAGTLGMTPGRWRVFASDIDIGVLEKARNGIYRLDEPKTLSPQQLQRCFMRGTGLHERLVRIRQELAGHAEFFSVSLLDKQCNVPGPFDAIFCRDVVIHSDKTAQQDILHRFVPLLRPDRLLFVDHSENFGDLMHEFSPHGQTVYAHASGRNKA